MNLCYPIFSYFFTFIHKLRKKYEIGDSIDKLGMYTFLIGYFFENYQKKYIKNIYKKIYMIYRSCILAN